MCEISVVNLHDANLNERLWLFMGVIGSQIKHDDGWGVASPDGKYFKCGIPMHYTLNSGEKIHAVSKKASMLLGHIRDASPKVPVNDKNAHPFQLNDITFVHNGKLNPLKEEDFIMEEEVPDIDSNTKKQCEDKNGKKLFKKVGRSDSLIFFEEFIKDWEMDDTVYDSEELKFISVVNTTMNKFYGTFAMVFIINGNFYICRGKTKELYISYLLKDTSKNFEPLGWAINTSRITLDTAEIMLGNLNSLDGKEELNFSFPVILDEESIFVAEEFGLRKIGALKEGKEPAKVYYSQKNNWDTYKGTTSTGGTQPANFTKTGETEETELEKVTHQIYDWMEAYSLSPQDIQNLLFLAHGTSTLEVTIPLLQAFYKNVLVKLSNKTTKKIRKAVRRSNSGFVGLYQYDKLSYPWMLNPENEQKKFIK